MPRVSNAVFLSYASEDAQAAERIAAALRSAAIEVWFDKSELRGGDAWDRHIREQIHDCRLFIAVISAHTEERTRVTSAVNGSLRSIALTTWPRRRPLSFRSS
jgi:hypothetical protein